MPRRSTSPGLPHVCVLSHPRSFRADLRFQGRYGSVKRDHAESAMPGMGSRPDSKITVRDESFSWTTRADPPNRLPMVRLLRVTNARTGLTASAAVRLVSGSGAVQA